MVTGLALALAAACAVPPARCSCFRQSEPRTAADAHAYLRGADDVVVGTVVRVEASGPHLERPAVAQESWDHVAATLAVTSRWRGRPADTVVVHTSSQPSMCGLDLRVGAAYFVVASRHLAGPEPRVERLTLWACGQTRPAAAAEQLRVLLGPPAAR